MPDIRLQDYTAKIKDLMQYDRLDEAIAHGQHILRHYPKHVETYRLLGEACLEKGMFREAIEFFQRTLSADPENLMARVGLGIIYEEQGALPEAIWQMERAFELAPGNTEVRQELLRLCAQRDGKEKSRLKLTRGALGRLCSRNGLYERAINEFRAVLRQDPDLPDIRVAFAEALWREGRRLEAVETCQLLVDELPFCLKANLILCEIWLQGGHEDAGKERLELARALDPEGLFAQEMMGKDSPVSVEEIVIPELEVTPDLLEAAAIPVGVGMAVAVVPEEPLEEVEWTTEEEAAELAKPWDMGEEMPDWLQEIGITEEEEHVPQLEDEVPSEEVAVDEQVPDWLQELVGEETAPVSEAIEEKTRAPEEIPEWLREIEMEDLEGETPPVAEELAEELAAVSEIPEWLAEIEMPEEEEEEEAIAPPIAKVVGEVIEPPGEFEAPGEAPLPEAEEFVEEAPFSVEEPEPVSPEAEIPGSLLALVTAGILSQADLESALEEMSAEELEAQQAEAVPEWLQDLLVEESPPGIEGLTAGEPGEEIPDWLREFEGAEEEELPPPVAEAVEEGVEPVAETQVEEIERMAELPAEEAEPVAEAPVEEFGLAEELPDWLRELGMLAEEEEVTPPPAVEELAEEMPAEEAEPVAEALVEELAPPPVVEEPVEELPTEEVEPMAEAPVEEFAPAEELPDWLRESGMPAAEEEFAPAEELPDWLRELGRPPAEEELTPPPAVEEPVERVEPVAEVPASLRALVEAGILDEADIGMAMAEMSPEDLEAQRAEAVPDWLQYLIDEEAAPAEAEPAIPPLAAEEVEEEIELIAEVPTEEVAPIEELPDWMREPEVSVPEAEVAPPPAVEELAEEVEPVAEVPESLRALVEAGILDESDLGAALAGMSPEELQAQYAEAVPDWLQDLIGEEAAPEEEAALLPIPEASAAELPPFEEEVLPVAEVAVEEVLVAEEEIAAPPVEEPVEAAPPVEAIAAPPQAPVEEVHVAEEPAPPVEEAPAEEALVAEEEIAAPPTELEMVAPYERVEIEEEAAPPARLDELLTHLKAKPRDYAARLELARLYSAERDWNTALDHYEKLIAARNSLPAVIDDLTSLTQEEVDQARVYQMLGDAHMQSEHLEKALEMYRLARQALGQR